MAASLDELTKNLPVDKFQHVRKFFPQDKLDLVVRKGVFCYDYLDSMEKLKTSRLPAKEHFYNKLNEQDVSDEDYAHARRVWEEFNIANLSEYCKLYLKVDVLLLADVFENFRSLCLEIYKLDPAFYFTAPGLAWDAALKHTKVVLDLIQDYDMLMMFEKGTRGGITQCSKRYSKADNKYLGNTQNTRNIFYVDSNNLYGVAMSMVLPTGGFQWVEPKDMTDITSVEDDASHGYVLEVDVEYPKELHDKHNGIPYLPEHLKGIGSKSLKLMTTFYKKEKYVVHYKVLKQAIKAGLRVTRYHRVIRFDQSAWLKSYIDLNTQLRTSAKNKFETDFFKLMNNAFFGKTMENVRKRQNVELVTTEKRLKK